MKKVTLQDRIKAAAIQFKTRTKIEDFIVHRLSNWERENFPRFFVRRIIAAVLRKTDPGQLELLIDGEPFPIAKFDDTDILRQRIAWENARGLAHFKRRDILQARLNEILREKEQVK